MGYCRIRVTSFTARTMNSRESLFPSRRETTAFGSHSGKQAESVRRQSSVAPLGRRTTMVGSFGATKTDPRPVRNVEFIRSCSAKVEEFVRGVAPREALSPKAFSSPTSRDFAILWETLFNALDTKWCKRMKGKKLEDQVPVVLKGLGYTLSISKSALGAPGSTHSWPQIVLALDWMVDVIELKHKYDGDALRPMTDAMEVDEGEDMLGMDICTIFDWMTESYEKYMSFDDATVKEIDGSFLSTIQNKQDHQKQENKDRHKEMEALEAEWKNVQQMPSPLSRMKTELDGMQQDETAFRAKIKQLEEMMVRLKRKAAELETEIQNKMSQIKGIQPEVEKLRERVSKQSINKEDINRLLNEKQKLERMLENAQLHKATVERDVNLHEVQRDGLLNQLEKCVHGYHNHARKLKLVPMGSKHSNGIDFTVGVDRNASEIQGLCTADHKGVLQPGLLQLKEHYQSKKTQLADQAIQMQGTCGQLREEIKKLQHQHNNCLLEIQKVETEREKYKEAVQNVKQSALEQCQSVDAEIERLHHLRQEMVQCIEQQLPEAEANYQETAERCQEEREEMKKVLTRAAQTLKDVCSTTENLLDNMNQQANESVEALEQLMDA